MRGLLISKLQDFLNSISYFVKGTKSEIRVARARLSDNRGLVACLIDDEKPDFRKFIDGEDMIHEKKV